jgi:hypothetical protein
MSATASRSLELRRFISERLYDRSLEQGAGSREPEAFITKGNQ